MGITIDIIEIVLIVLLIAVLVVLFGIKKSLDSKKNDQVDMAAELAEFEEKIEQQIDRELEKARLSIENEIKGSRMETIQYIQVSFKSMADMITSNQKESAEAQDKRLAELSRKFSEMSIQNDTKLSEMTMQTEQKLENIRKTMETRISAMNEDNNKQLELMRNTVDEKLQKTLEDRITQSFKVVAERLEQVYKGLGEMQNLATGVGDLKKILSNVKTRGIFGEIQLGAILEQILSSEQYETNIATVEGSKERVEYAVKLPGEGDKPVYLPIDAKFPADTYARLSDAYETGDLAQIEAATKLLIATIKNEAKSISEKYVYPPDTTDFAVMFLPVEGLYAEVVRTPGLVESLQKEYKVVIAGPTTMAAILNSMQMGFRTLAIQKHSSQVWEVLGAVRTEFEKFGGVLQKTQERLRQADRELDTLIGTRTNVIRQKLKNVQSLPEMESDRILGIEMQDLDIEI